MADNVGGAGSGDALLAQLLQSALSASQQQNDSAADSERKSDAVQRQLLQKYVEKKSVESSQQHGRELKESYTSERAVDHNWRQLAEGRAGPELMKFANQESLQGKVSGKLKQMFYEAAATDPGRAEQAAGVLNQLVTTQTFAQIAPTARDVGELAARVLENPKLAAPLQEALEHPFTKSADSDAGTKQQLAKFASRQTDASAMAKGASVRMAGDMLGTLTGLKVPGFAQKAALQMVERNPENTQGIKNVDAFVREPAVKGMPQVARGQATAVLAKGDGKTELKDSLTEVAKNNNFRGMDRKDKAKLFATVGQGRAGDLRAITDKTLQALKQKDFPRGAQQVEVFLGGLARGVQRSVRGDAGGAGVAAGGAAAEAHEEGGVETKGAGAARGARASSGASAIDPEELVRAARRGGMPAKPSLRRIPDSTDERGGEVRGDAAAAGGSDEAATTDGGRGMHNRASLQAYFSKVSRHYERIEQKIKAAQYFEDVNLLGGLKEPEEPDLSPLQVRDEVRGRYDGRLAELKGQLDARQLTRAAYVKQLRQLQSEAFAEPQLRQDEKSYVYAKTAHAQATQSYQELSGKKHRKLREVKNKLLPPDKRRAKLEGRRPTGARPRFFRTDGMPVRGGVQPGVGGSTGGGAGPRSGSATSPDSSGTDALVGRAGPGAVTAARGSASATAGAAAAASTRLAARSAQAGMARGPNAARPSASAGQAQEILRQIDGSLSPKEQVQQAKELLAHQLQQQAMAMASELMDAILGGSAGGGAANAAPGASRTEMRSTSGTGGVTATPTTTGRTNFYGVPQSFERDLGAGRGRSPVRPAAAGRGAGHAEEVGRLGRPLLGLNVSVRSLQQLTGVPMKQMNSAEANALRNLGWDTMSWAAQGQPGANTPTTYLTPFASLRPLQKDSVRALGLNEDTWNAMVANLRAV